MIARNCPQHTIVARWTLHVSVLGLEPHVLVAALLDDLALVGVVQGQERVAEREFASSGAP
jgi:hypothetical protein